MSGFELGIEECLSRLKKKELLMCIDITIYDAAHTETGLDVGQMLKRGSCDHCFRVWIWMTLLRHFNLKERKGVDNTHEKSQECQQSCQKTELQSEDSSSSCICVVAF